MRDKHNLPNHRVEFHAPVLVAEEDVVRIRRHAKSL